MTDKFLKSFLIKNTTEKKTKGFVEKTMEIVKKGKDKTVSLKEVKELAKLFDKEKDKKGGKYIIRARNIYRDNLTIRDFDGNYYDDDDPNYYNVRGYNEKKYEEFFRIQIISVK